MLLGFVTDLNDLGSCLDSALELVRSPPQRTLRVSRFEAPEEDARFANLLARDVAAHGALALDLPGC